jgi:hypothetical protein
MEILSSGSFINLDNEEKIEQLVFTAQEIAETAIKTEGFIANEENNKKLALDIWQGAEYMCRDAEEMQIKNIFVSNFLERMNELSSESKIAENRAEISESKPETNRDETFSKDEYLGLVNADENQKQESLESDVDLKESAERYDNGEVETSEKISETEVKNEEFADVAEPNAIDVTEPNDTETPKPVEFKQKDSTDSAEIDKLEKEEKESKRLAATGSITLPEKEPYQLDKCTITATIQLFPTDSDTRKVVLSVRTHDFAPQISVHEITGEATPEQLVPALGEALGKYKTDLPVKVMDKLRKEKESGDGKKKKRKRFAQTTSSESSQTNTANTAEKTSEVEKDSSECEETSVSVPQTQTDMQGSLFGA